MSKKRITLPDAEEMLKRLLTTSDIESFQETFYPLLQKSAGRTLNASGIVMIFTLAIAEFTKGMDPSVMMLLFTCLPDFIDTLVDDKEVAQEAKDFLEKAQKKADG